MTEISNIDAIFESILKEARQRVKHDFTYGLHEVMNELSARTHDLFLTLQDEERRKKEDENNNQRKAGNF